MLDKMIAKFGYEAVLMFANAMVGAGVAIVIDDVYLQKYSYKTHNRVEEAVRVFGVGVIGFGLGSLIPTGKR